MFQPSQLCITVEPRHVEAARVRLGAGESVCPWLMSLIEWRPKLHWSVDARRIECHDGPVRSEWLPAPDLERAIEVWYEGGKAPEAGSYFADANDDLRGDESWR